MHRAPRGYSVADVAARLGASWRGREDVVVTGVAPLAEAGPSDVSVYLDRRYRPDARSTTAGVVIVGPDLAADLPPERVLIAADPRSALWHVLKMFAQPPDRTPTRSPSAHVDPTSDIDTTARIDASATIGARAVIGAGVHVGSGARIGDRVALGEGTSIGPNAVVMDDVVIGTRVYIGPGSVVGGPGFGFAEIDGRVARMPHVGTVIIEDDVEIGANCTIDRATMGATRIGRGCKLDSLVHVAHNVTIGAGVMIAAQCGVAGSTTIGEGTLMGGQAGVADHVVIAPGSRIAAKSAVMKSVAGKVAGSPARPLVEQRRMEAALRALANRGRKRRPASGDAPTSH